jgi:hypothetical protein
MIVARDQLTHRLLAEPQRMQVTMCHKLVLWMGLSPGNEKWLHFICLEFRNICKKCYLYGCSLDLPVFDFML